FINPKALVGGALKLNAEKARLVFAEKVANPLGMAIERAAYGAFEIATSNMIQAIKAVSTERGRDPPDFALFAFGGNGRYSPRLWRWRSASVAWWCRRRRGCFHLLDFSTRTSSIITPARCAACCAAPTSPRSALPGTRSRAKRKPSWRPKVLSDRVH